MAYEADKEYLKELRLFSAHHRHSVNALIHVISIAMEWYGWNLLLVSQSLLLGLVLTVLVVYFVYLSNTSSSLIAGSLHMLLLIGAHLTSVKQPMHAILLCGGIQVSSWFAQVVIGHFLLENNNPSMTKRLSVQSVVWSLCLAVDNSLSLDKKA
ncbi:MAG: hypothetical protein EOO88_02560 [Pedobacter sp.]|nr:MAG: hypothetical protein EOO88_02560 [Pedobacter sp.]